MPAVDSAALDSADDSCVKPAVLTVEGMKHILHFRALGGLVHGAGAFHDRKRCLFYKGFYVALFGEKKRAYHREVLP